MANLSPVGKLLRLPLKLIPKNLTITFLFGPLKGFKWITGASNHSYWLGIYEKQMKSLLVDSLEKGNVFFDLGGHVGYYSLLGSRCVGNGGKVFCFEPLPRNVHYLKQHMEMNSIRNVVVYEGAVAHFDGDFNLSDTSPVGAKLSHEGRLRVRVFSLRNLIESKSLPVPDVIKMDIEGAETELLFDLKTLLASSKIKIFLSTHGSAVHSSCVNFLKDLNYELVALDGDTVDECTELYCFRQ